MISRPCKDCGGATFHGAKDAMYPDVIEKLSEKDRNWLYRDTRTDSFDKMKRENPIEVCDNCKRPRLDSPSGG